MESITFYNKAEELLNSAKEEMMRPEEDVVQYPICEKCFHSIGNYLKGYLHHYQIDFSESAEVSHLLDLAIEKNIEFKKLDQSFLKNPKDTEDVWMSNDRAHDFIALAEKTRFMVGL